MQSGVVAYTYNPSTWQVEAGEAGIQSQPWLQKTLSQKSKCCLTNIFDHIKRKQAQMKRIG